MPDFADGSDALVFALVVLRLLVPLFIPRFPLPAILVALVVDAADHTIFQQLTDLDLAGYQVFDKGLDIYYLAVAYIATIRNWGGGHAFVIARFLWYWRLVGVALFEYTNQRWLLVIFPNTFEYFFITIELIKLSRNPFSLTDRQLTAIAAAIWIVVKIPQELWIHVAKLDVTDVLKEHVFGVAADSRWSAAVSNRPLGLVLVIAVCAVLAWVVRLLLRRLPPAEFTRTFDADEQGHRFGWPTPDPKVVPTSTFGWSFVEKVVLVSLITMVFLRIVPSADRTVLGVVSGTSALVAVSTVRNRWLAERSVFWSSVGVQFVAMFVADVVLVLVSREVLPTPRGRSPVGSTLFLTALLTLMVVLFDRSEAVNEGHWRARRAARAERAAARLGAI